VPLPTDSASVDVTRFSFIAYGDTRGGRDGLSLQANHQRVIESMLGTIKSLADGPDAVRFVLQSGDAVSDGRDAAQWNVSYSPLINRLTREGGVPYFPSVGNHDVSSALTVDAPLRIDGLCHFFEANAQLIPAEGAPHRLAGYPAYSFGFGQWFFVAFDSNIAEDDAQFDWVRSELEGLDRERFPNVVVFFHHPPLSSGPHGGPRIERPTQFLRDAYLPLFRRHHVRLLLTGHDHLFEHWVERYTDSTGGHRLDQIVSGGGGAPAYRYTGEPDLARYLETGADQRVSVEHLVRPEERSADNPTHYVLIRVNGPDLNVSVVGVSDRGFRPYGKSSIDLKDSRRDSRP
jgi:hypothetical protein